MLTRLQFDQACGAFIDKHVAGWSWNEHTSFPGLGYMSRTTIHTRRLDTDLTIDDQLEDLDTPDDDDSIAISSVPRESLTCQQYVVYSATFQTPAFYFTVHDSNGAPLPLSDLVQTSLFHPFAFEGTESTTFALTLPTSSFPLLSQGEHPTLRSPCWYFHPCETAKAVKEILSLVERQEPLHWLEAWFMVAGCVVNLRG